MKKLHKAVPHRKTERSLLINKAPDHLSANKKKEAEITNEDFGLNELILRSKIWTCRASIDE